jgi:fatty acid desaturase
MELAHCAGEIVRILFPYNTDDLTERNNPMLWTIFVILLVLWLLGLVTGVTLHNFIWLLLVIALVVLIIQLLSGRRS